MRLLRLLEQAMRQQPHVRAAAAVAGAGPVLGAEPAGRSVCHTRRSGQLRLLVLGQVLWLQQAMVASQAHTQPPPQALVLCKTRQVGAAGGREVREVSRVRVVLQLVLLVLQLLVQE